MYFEWGGITHISYIQHIKKNLCIVYKSCSRMKNLKASTFETDIKMEIDIVHLFMNAAENC